MIRRFLFICGIAAPLLYVVAVILGGLLRPGYSHVSMAVSELIESGARNKTLLEALFAAYNVLLIVFSWAVGMGVRGDGRGLAVCGAAIIGVVGVLGLLMTLFFPMDPRGTTATITGAFHLVLAGALSIGSILAILFLAQGLKVRDGFWVYSMASCALVLITGGFAAVSAAQGSPVMGLAERLTIGFFLQWIVGLGAKMIAEDIGR